MIKKAFEGFIQTYFWPCVAVACIVSTCVTCILMTLIGYGG